MAPMFPLVVIVHADEDVRIARLIEHRGFTEADARARIAAQATEDQRRAVADVWLDNAGTADDLAAAARALWQDRIVPFADNLHAGRPARRARASYRPMRRGPSRPAASSPGSPRPAGTGPCASITSDRRPCPVSTPRTSSTSR